MHGQAALTTMIVKPQLIPLTTDAAKAIGALRTSDYDRMGSIDLEAQIKGLADAAAATPLAAVLRSDAVKTVAAAYNIDNGDAIRRQRWFKWVGRVAMWAAFLGTMMRRAPSFPRARACISCRSSAASWSSQGWFACWPCSWRAAGCAA